MTLKINAQTEKSMTNEDKDKLLAKFEALVPDEKLIIGLMAPSAGKLQSSHHAGLRQEAWH